jgi:hypothetical protein
MGLGGHVFVLMAALAAAESPAYFSVSAFTPSTSSAAVPQGNSEEAAVFLSGKQALTVTFTHAVIALGSDFGPGALPDALNPFEMSPPVAGSVHWVTTSIARFDPAADWPTDLTLRVRAKPGIRSYAGLALDPSTNSAHTFSTPQLEMSAGRVRSALALAVTNGSWDASLHPIVPGALELPPDAAVELSFTHAVDLPTLAGSLILDPPGCASSNSGSGLILESCVRPSPGCVTVSLRCDDGAESALAVGGVHRLLLPKGYRYHSECGVTMRELSVIVSGLVPFSIPFTQVSTAGGGRGGRAEGEQAGFIRA